MPKELEELLRACTALQQLDNGERRVLSSAEVTALKEIIVFSSQGIELAESVRCRNRFGFRFVIRNRVAAAQWVRERLNAYLIRVFVLANQDIAFEATELVSDTHPCHRLYLKRWYCLSLITPYRRNESTNLLA